MTYNFHLPSMKPYPHISCSLTTALKLVSKPKNCELKQKVHTLPTQISITHYSSSIEYQHHKAITHYRQQLFFFHSQDSCLSVPVFLQYAANEIPISFPYRDTRTIRESYRRVIEKIPGFLWERKIVSLLTACLLFYLCFNSQFCGLETSCRAVVSEKRR